MPPKKYKAPPNVDYDPVTGAFPNISFGVVETVDVGGRPRRLEDVVVKRLFPTERPNPFEPWPVPTAYRAEVLLPRGASDHLVDPQQLCAAFHGKPGDQIQHLAAVVTIRFPEVDEVPQRMRLHEAVELGRDFGRRLTGIYNTAVVFCMHVPATSWGIGVPHSHLCVPLRVVLPGSQFSRFVTALTDPEEGRRAIDDAYRSFLQETGHGE